MFNTSLFHLHPVLTWVAKKNIGDINHQLKSTYQNYLFWVVEVGFLLKLDNLMDLRLEMG